MGNKFTRRRLIVDERYTRPQGLYQHRDIDHRKLRRLILNGQLGPCFPGVEDPAAELDECPICFLFYPSLNRSKCCTKGICTECYLQIKTSNSARSTQCPFCKTANYAVEYRGAKTVEEKGVEQAEEQKVIEAKIRIRQKELLDEEQRLLRREEDVREGRLPAVTELLRRNFSNLHGFTVPSENSETVPSREQDTDTFVGAVSNNSNNAHQDFSENAIVAATAAGLPVADSGPTPEVETVMHYNTSRLLGSHARLNREDDFDLDLEDIMLMEAIWRSIQEQGQSRQDSPSANTVLGMFQSAGNQMDQGSMTETDCAASQAHVLSTARGVARRNSMTGGLAGAIAALAEQQVIGVDGIVGRQTSQQSPQNDTPHEDSNGDLLSENSNPRILHGLGDHQVIDDRAGAFLSTVSMPQTQEGANEDMEREEQHAKAEMREVTCQDQDVRQELNNWIEVSIESGRAIPPLTRGESRGSISDWVLDQSSEVVEVGTSFSSSVPSTSELPWEAPDVGAHQNPGCAAEPPVIAPSAPMLPDSFEEQIMLAMALSLAEAQAQARRS